ncbi:hypothetical protein CJ030_MR7G027600 [Morella rubra]|uniref:Retrotransposon Copia-like N-terminal domain-containing protein n=1 Tax=Morella rubra TaxID=262757 RepID=A0A6A1V585_9ROSI|nr:hypothetical protein CJ030_MR7G027600 [Morella rubra]
MSQLTAPPPMIHPKTPPLLHATLHGSSSSGPVNTASLLPFKLTGSNYPAWRAQFIIITIGYDLLGYIDGTLPAHQGLHHPPWLLLNTFTSIGRTSFVSTLYLHWFLRVLCLTKKNDF